MMRTGVTASGFAWQLDDAVLNNMELVDALAEMQEENPLQISAVCRLVLGKASARPCMTTCAPRTAACLPTRCPPP